MVGVTSATSRSRERKVSKSPGSPNNLTFAIMSTISLDNFATKADAGRAAQLAVEGYKARFDLAALRTAAHAAHAAQGTDYAVVSAKKQTATRMSKTRSELSIGMTNLQTHEIATNG
jgi:hypothetical protein